MAVKMTPGLAGPWVALHTGLWYHTGVRRGSRTVQPGRVPFTTPLNKHGSPGGRGE